MSQENTNEPLSKTAVMRGCGWLKLNIIMKTDFKKLLLTPDNTKLFQETNQYHPTQISLEKYSPEKIPYNGFAILIEDFEKGNYTLVNSVNKPGHTANNYFEPFMQQPLKTIEDLNNLVKIFNGKGLTLIKASENECSN